MKYRTHQVIIKAYINKDDDIIYWMSQDPRGKNQKEAIFGHIISLINKSTTRKYKIPSNFREINKVNCENKRQVSFYITQKAYDHIDDYRKEIIDMTGTYINMNVLLKTFIKTIFIYENEDDYPYDFLWNYIKEYPIKPIMDSTRNKVVVSDINKNQEIKASPDVKPLLGNYMNDEQIKDSSMGIPPAQENTQMVDKPKGWNRGDKARMFIAKKNDL